MTFLVRDAKAEDAGAIAQRCAEFAEYLCSVGRANAALD